MTDISSRPPASRSIGTWFRQVHRWLSIIFTLSVITTVIALAQPEPLVWISYIPLLPLFLLMGSGLYLFALPHMTVRRARRGASH